MYWGRQWQPTRLNPSWNRQEHKTTIKYERPRHVVNPGFYRLPDKPPDELSEYVRYVARVNEERLSDCV